MIINYFNIKGVAAAPYKTYTPLFVDTYAVLPFSVMMQTLKLIGWRNTEGFKDGCGIQNIQFYCSHPLYSLRKFPGKMSVKQLFGLLALEGLYHMGIISCLDIIVKGYYRLIRLTQRRSPRNAQADGSSFPAALSRRPSGDGRIHQRTCRSSPAMSAREDLRSGRHISQAG